MEVDGIDRNRLLQNLNRMVDSGHSVVVISTTWT
jgi:hypothetical protein